MDHLKKFAECPCQMTQAEHWECYYKKQIDALTKERDLLAEKLLFVRIYSVLVACSGAPYGLLDDFVRYMTDDESLPKEFRFQGKYGFGGKLYRTHDRVYVSCYSEDRKPEIEASMDRVNYELKIMFDRKIPVDEQWLHRNPEALASVKRGLKQAKKAAPAPNVGGKTNG